MLHINGFVEKDSEGLMEFELYCEEYPVIGFRGVTKKQLDWALKMLHGMGAYTYPLSDLENSLDKMGYLPF